MLAGKTVLVLGAGSSLEFGMPLGSALKNDIVGLLTFDDGDELVGDPEIVAALHHLFPGEDKDCIEAARALSASLPHFNSIDDFLHTHGDDAKVSKMGKLAIARAISSKESASPVRELWSPDTFEKALGWAVNTWPRIVANIAATGIKAKDCEHVFDDLSVITFNYDRCAESIFYSLLQPIFNVGTDVAATAMGNLRVFRPYGGLGELPYNGAPGTLFGGTNPDLVAMSDKIQVYTEELGDRPDLIEMKQALAAASSIVFLGFGFHTQNVDLLALDPQIRDAGRKVLTTAHSEPNAARPLIQNQIRRTLTNLQAELGYPHEDCSKVLTDHRRLLAR